MPQGLQIWDASGNLIYDTTENLAKILGVATVGGGAASGTIVDSRFAMANHTTWYAVIKGQQWDINNSLRISISGTTLTWTFPSALRPSTTFLYGVV